MSMAGKVLSVEFTNYCNKKCSFCPNSTDPRKKGFIAEETIEKIIKEVQGEKLAEVHPTGLGETFLHPEWEKFTSRLIQEYPDASLHMTTNGILLGKKNIEALGRILREQDCLTISLNTMGSPHYLDIINNWYYWLVKTNTLALLKASREYTVKVQYMITAKNFWKLPFFVTYWKLKGADAIFFRFLENWGGLITDGYTFLRPRAGRCIIPDTQVIYTWEGERRPCCIMLAEGVNCDRCNAKIT
jgi:MoaA/NifB/PqqE/SkfB family radical SAM enzyme